MDTISPIILLSHTLVLLLTAATTALVCLLIARRHLSRLQGVHASEVSRYEAEVRRSEERFVELKEAREQMRHEFQSLASEIIETKASRFTEQNKNNLDTLLAPLQTQIKDFREQMVSTHTQQTRDRAALKTEIEMIRNLNSEMTQEARNLTNALKNETKTQGVWGELILERLLEASGLRKGIEYLREVHCLSDDGQRRRPDVIINMPDNKQVIVDSKVSLKAYESFCSAQNEDDRRTSLDQHVQSLRRHVKLLSDKNYQDLPGIKTVDFVLMFIPLDPAYIAAAQHGTDLLLEAFDRRIVIVGPSTLLATLRTIQNVWRFEQQNCNALKIADEAGKLYDKFVAFSQCLDGLGLQLTKAQESFAKTRAHLIEGRGNLVARVEKLSALGAKTKKKMAGDLLEAADDGEVISRIAPASLINH